MLVMRLMGKRQAGQLQPFDLVIAVMIAEVASTPMAGAACIARNAENRGGSGTIATMRPGAVEGEFEVVIRQTAISPTVLLVATLAPAAQGSRADIAVRTDLIFTTPEAYARQHIIGC